MNIEEAVPVFERDPRVLALYLLGSANGGNMRPDSDIDLGILTEPGTRIDGPELIDLSAAAALILGREVDLGSVSSRNLVYSREAILGGRRVFTRDRYRAELREAGLLGMYVRFNEERKEVLDAWRA